MGKVTKGLCLLLVILLAVTIMLTIHPTHAQSIPKPSIPIFTLKFSDNSYNIPPITTSTINPYTNQTTTTTNPGRFVENKTIDIIINNPQSGQSLEGLYYNIRFKGHYEKNWTSQLAAIPPDSNGDLDVYVVNWLASGRPYSDKTVISYPANSQIFPAGGEVDFQLQAVRGSIITTTNYQHIIPIQGPSYFSYSSSGWSQTQTIKILENPPAPSPTVPELSWLQLLPFCLIVMCVALMLRRYKTFNGFQL